jgi:hypothetical protein
MEPLFLGRPACSLVEISYELSQLLFITGHADWLRNLLSVLHTGACTAIFVDNGEDLLCLLSEKSHRRNLPINTGGGGGGGKKTTMGYTPIN